MRKCPECGCWCADSAQSCDCGHALAVTHAGPPVRQDNTQEQPLLEQPTPTHRAISFVANSLTLVLGLLGLGVALRPWAKDNGFEYLWYFLYIPPPCLLLTILFFLAARDHDRKAIASASMAGLRLLGLAAGVLAVAWVAFSVLLG